MILESQVQLVRFRTASQKDPLILAELNSAQDWAWNRLITSNNDLLKTDDTEKVLVATTSSYDLAANVSTTVTLVAVKWLGVKFASDSKFNPVLFIDASDDRFISAQQDPVATGSPVYAAMENFSSVRFAPSLPSGATLRIDYIYAPADMDFDTNVIMDLPLMIHNAVADKATAQVMVTMDDDRAVYWEGQALSKFYSASNAINRRQYAQQPRTRPATRYRPSLMR